MLYYKSVRRLSNLLESSGRCWCNSKIFKKRTEINNGASTLFIST